jgi:hypothetical protein
MTTIKELHEVMTTEAQLTEGLVAVLHQQQAAIIYSHIDDLNVLLVESEELMQPIESLELERARLSKLIVRGTGVDGKPVTSNELLSCLDENDAVSMSSVIRRLRTASQEVIRINGLNKPLLEHSQHFIKQTLRAATDDYRKNLVDKRI